MLNSIVPKKAVISLMLARIFYTVNWFNVPAIFIFIAVDFDEDISVLGLITASFFIGVGLFQVIAGILAAKYSPRKIAILGIAIASTAVFFSAFSTDLLSIAVLRFIVGLGMAFFFGPSVILISQYVGKQSEGLGMGLLNSAHAIGGIIGLFGWVLVAEYFGWRTSIVLSAIAGIITLIILQIWLPRTTGLSSDKRTRIRADTSNEQLNRIPYTSSNTGAENQRFNFRSRFGHVQHILLNKSLIKLGLVLLGFQIGSGLIWSYIVFYLADHIKINPAIAGLIGSLNLIVAIVSSPIVGKAYDKLGNARKLLAISGIISAVSIMMIGVLQSQVYLIGISVVVAGFFLSWGFVIVYVKAKQVNTKSPPAYQTLSVSYVNGISLFGAFWIPILFASLSNQFGYMTAWVVGGAIFLALVIPVLTLKE
ncbi:MAG TPA: MFS transporter [Nitrososphaeraceae archaeon]|nr:MFS transporter [Nitrososphaeraceae archaeon]